MLLKDFSREDIRVALADHDPSKAPGLDDFENTLLIDLNYARMYNFKISRGLFWK